MCPVRFVLVVALLCSGLRTAAAEEVELELVLDPTVAPASGGRAIPGRGEVTGPPPQVAYRMQWDDYITHIVIEQGSESRRRVWVSTHKQEGGKMDVAYCGTAYTDPAGDVHIDCQRVVLTGPEAANWSPDSFAIQADGTVRTIDDANRAHLGKIIEKTTGGAAASPAERQRYRSALGHVQAMVEGAL